MYHQTNKFLVLITLHEIMGAESLIPLSRIMLIRSCGTGSIVVLEGAVEVQVRESPQKIRDIISRGEESDDNEP